MAGRRAESSPEELMMEEATWIVCEIEWVRPERCCANGDHGSGGAGEAAASDACKMHP
jgi:hypothetical protein